MADPTPPANGGYGFGLDAASLDMLAQAISAHKALEEQVKMMNQLFSDERATYMDMIKSMAKEIELQANKIKLRDVRLKKLEDVIKLQAARIKELEGVDGARHNGTDGGASAAKVDTKEESKEGLEKEPEEDA